MFFTSNRNVSPQYQPGSLRTRGGEGVEGGGGGVYLEDRAGRTCVGRKSPHFYLSGNKNTLTALSKAGSSVFSSWETDEALRGSGARCPKVVTYQLLLCPQRVKAAAITNPPWSGSTRLLSVVKNQSFLSLFSFARYG